MRGNTYVYFNGKTEYIGTGGEEQTAYPLGALVFGTLDVDWEPYLEQARALRRAYTGVDFGETCTLPQRLSEPETCVYYQVAEFYHNMTCWRDTAWQYGVPTTRKVSRILRPWPPA